MTPAPLPPSSALFARLTPDQRAAVERAALEVAKAVRSAFFHVTFAAGPLSVAVTHLPEGGAR